MEETVHALHPDPGKLGVNISKTKYEQMRSAITEALASREDLTFIELTSQVRHKLAETFKGSIEWYLVTVKLDMEARGMVERIPGRIQRLRLVKTEAEG